MSDLSLSFLSDPMGAPDVSTDGINALLAFSPDALLLIDQTGSIVVSNDQAATLFGYQPADLVDQRLEFLLPTRFHSAHRLHRESYLASPHKRPMGKGLELFGRRADETEFPVDVSLRPLMLAGQLRILAAVRDMTSQRETERIRILAAERQHILMKEAERLKDEFIGLAAHELRTPLAVLKSASSMLRVQTERGHGPPLADWQQEALQEIEVATERLVTLADDLLDVTRLQAGRLQLYQVPTDLTALARRVVSQLQTTTNTHQMELCSPQNPLLAVVDAKRIEQVLTNLIGNAIKYSPQGGPVTVSLREESSRGEVLVSVQDAGMGIPFHQQAQIFGRFMRAENVRGAGITGSGLGLYLCRELVIAHGGRLWFQSVEDKGTIFFLALPLAQIDPTQCQ
jgi:PAS domain S-box-containing protein